MNDLKILGKDANICFKNIEFYIRNPRKTIFRVYKKNVKLNKHEYLNINKPQSKLFLQSRLHDFNISTKVIIPTHEENKRIYKTDNPYPYSNYNFDEFKPMFDNYVLIKPHYNLFHIIGYWIRKQKQGDYLISTFFIKNNLLSLSPIDWLIRNYKNANKKNSRIMTGSFLEKCMDSVKKSFIAENEKHNLKINIDKILPFYYTYTAPTPNFLLKSTWTDDNTKRVLLNTILSWCNYSQVSMIPSSVLQVTEKMNDLYKRRELKIFNYKEEAVKRTEMETSFYEYKIVSLSKEILTSTRYVRSVNTNKRHKVRGFTREYKSGKKVWIDSHFRGDINKGFIDKDYTT